MERLSREAKVEVKLSSLLFGTGHRALSSPPPRDISEHAASQKGLVFEKRMCVCVRA